MSSRWFALVSLICGLAVALGGPARAHNSDSLIPILVSLEHWTPFFWGQDRFGMPLALAASPIRSGLWNLVAQNAASIALLVAGLHALLRRLQIAHAEVAALGTLLALLVWPSAAVPRVLLTTEQSYAPALGLIGFALAAVASSSRYGVAVAITTGVVATWLNAGVSLLVVCVAAVACAWPRLRRPAAVMAAGALAGLALHRLLAEAMPHVVDTTHVRVPPPEHVWPLLGSFWRRGYIELVGRGHLLVALAGAGCLAAAASAQWRAGIVAVVAGSALYGSIMAVAFDGLPRHLAPVLAVLLAIGLARLLVHLPRLGRSAIAAGVVAVLLAAWPRSPERLRGDLLARFEPEGTAVALRDGVAAVTGDYWTVWPVVFSASHLVPGPPRTPIVPVTLRSDVLSRDVRFAPGTRVLAIPRGDLDHWRHMTGTPLAEPCTTTRGVDVCVVR